MKFHPSIFHSKSCRAALVGISTLFCLTACGEKEAEAQTAPADSTPAPAEAPAPAEEAAPAPAPAAETDKLAETRDALFNHAVYTLGQRVSSPDSFPELNTMVTATQHLPNQSLQFQVQEDILVKQQFFLKTHTSTLFQKPFLLLPLF